MNLWAWLFGTTLEWYAVCIRNPGGASGCTSANKMSRSAAIEWLLDTQEANWGSSVALLRWTGISWIEV